MPPWCSPILLALAQRATPCRIFFRDDDAGWHDARLFELLAVFSRHRTAIDLALIPAELTPALTNALLPLMTRSGAPAIGVHQHGYCHANLETEGRKCEFGPSRDYPTQLEDIERGQALMRSAFGSLADDIFTPPWNRCTLDTAQALVDLGFAALSRDVGAAAFELPGLQELPIAVDWCKLRRPGSSPDALAHRIASCIGSADRCGIMLHHAVMDDADHSMLEALLPLLSKHPMAECTRMRALLSQPPGARSPAIERAIGGAL